MDGYVGKIVSGAEFKKLAAEANWTLVKYFASNNFSKPQPEHFGYSYKVGLNQIPEDEVNLNPKRGCSGGGLHFTYVKSYNWINYYWFAVTVPDNAQVLFERNKKFKTDKLIILDEIHPTEAMYLEVVKRDGSYLRYIRKQTEAMCLAAAKSGVNCLRYMQFQTEEICLITIRRYKLALRDVKKQNKTICMAAVQNYGLAIQYVNKLTPELEEAAIKQNAEVADLLIIMKSAGQACYACNIF